MWKVKRKEVEVFPTIRHFCRAYEFQKQLFNFTNSIFHPIVFYKIFNNSENFIQKMNSSDYYGEHFSLYIYEYHQIYGQMVSESCDEFLKEHNLKYNLLILQTLNLKVKGFQDISTFFLFVFLSEMWQNF